VSRAQRAWLWSAAVLLALPFILLALLFTAANTPVGQRLIERAAAHLSHGQILLAGLAGRFPGSLRAERLELRDAGGAWLIATGLELEISATPLLRRRLAAARLDATHVLLIRAHASSGGGSSYLRDFDIDAIRCRECVLGPALAGSDAVFDLRGSLHIRPDNTYADIAARRLDGPGDYQLRGDLGPARVHASAEVHEPADGPLANVAGVPGLGAVLLQIKIDGSGTKQALQLSLNAGALRANADGTVDWTARTAEMDLQATAPAMAPRSGLSWQSLSLEAHYHGAFSAPVATADFAVRGALIGGVRVRLAQGEIRAAAGTATLSAVLEGLQLPGIDPSLTTGKPVALRAAAHADGATWQADFSLVHPLLALDGGATTGPNATLRFTANAPTLAAFSAVAGLDLQGRGSARGTLTRDGAGVHAAVTGTLSSLRASGVLAALGPSLSFDTAASWRAGTLAIEYARAEGRALRFAAEGTRRSGNLDLRWSAALADLGALVPGVAGTANVRGTLHGASDELAGEADVRANVSVAGLPRAPIDVAVRMAGLPHRPSATLESSGSLDGAPLRLSVAFERQPDGAARATIREAQWKTVVAAGALTLARGSTPASGRISVQVAHLDDLQRLAGTPLRGSFTGEVEFLPAGASGRARVRLAASQLGVAAGQIEQLTVAGNVGAPFADPVLALHGLAQHVTWSGFSGEVRLDATGPWRRTSLSLTSSWSRGEARVGDLAATGSLDAAPQRLTIATLSTAYAGTEAKLLAPATIRFGHGLAVDALRLGVQDAVFELRGTLSPELRLSASLRHGNLATLAPLIPGWPLDGLVTADARLSGSLDRPDGSMQLRGTGLRLRGVQGRSGDSAEAVATITLHAGDAVVDLQGHAGRSATLSVAGDVPVRSGLPLRVHATGVVAAALLNPFLEAQGRRVRGDAHLNVNLAGTWSAPELSGSIVIENGDFQDFVYGAHLTAISASLQANGREIRVERLTARAGSGTISAEGTLGVLLPNLPVELRLTAVNAQPVSSDLLTAQLDATLTLRGSMTERIAAAGQVQVKRAEITIPNALPREVAVLDVRRPGARGAPPRPHPFAVDLDLTVSAPRAVFVRGRGLDAEMGGELHVTGTAALPQFSGGFDLRRGTLALGGASLKFTSGRVSLFSGTGTRNALDPTLDFLATSSTGGLTATLVIGGYASAPTITLTSTPEAPQDEILAQLLFGTTAKQLTPLQLLSTGRALAAISGVGYGAADPLAAIQKRFGLDRLAVAGSSDPTSNAATMEAGRYVSSRVYVGAAQSTSGNTKIQAQVDLSKHLKLQTTLGNGSATAQGTTPQNDPGSTIGLTYQIDY